jgi:hypothetical protein
MTCERTELDSLLGAADEAPHIADVRAGARSITYAELRGLVVPKAGA